MPEKSTQMNHPSGSKSTKGNAHPFNRLFRQKGFLSQPRTVSGISAASMALLVSLGGYYLVASSHAATITQVKTGLIASSLSNSSKQVMCLDDYQNGTANNTSVNIFPCNRTDPGQIWTSYSDHTIRIHGKCLDVYQASHADGAKIELFTCNGNSNQSWLRGTNPHISLNNLVGGGSSKCLDDSNYGTANNNRTQLYSCNGGTAQVWGWVTSSEPIVEGGETRFSNCHSTIAGGNTCYYWVQSQQSNNDNFTAQGVQTNMTVGNPTIGHQWPGDGGLLHHAVAEIYVTPADHNEAIEIGWYKDINSKTFLFGTRWLAGQAIYIENGGSGFVQVSSSVHFGQALTIGAVGTYKILHAGSQWQMWYNGTEVGYFPESLWTSKGLAFSYITHASVYGEVATGAYTVSKTQMGNGTLGSNPGSTSFSNYSLIGSSVPGELTSFAGPQSPANTAYNYGSTSTTGFSFGGPGL